MALLIAAQRCYAFGADGIESAVALFLFLAPVLAAASRLSGPLIPRSFLRIFWRGAHDWR